MKVRTQPYWSIREIARILGWTAYRTRYFLRTRGLLPPKAGNTHYVISKRAIYEAFPELADEILIESGIFE